TCASDHPRHAYLGSSESRRCQPEPEPFRIFAIKLRAMKARERTAWKEKLEGMRREALGKGPVRIEPNRKDAAETGVADEDAQALSEMLQAIGSQRNTG